MTTESSAALRLARCLPAAVVALYLYGSTLTVNAEVTTLPVDQSAAALELLAQAVPGSPEGSDEMIFGADPSNPRIAIPPLPIELPDVEGIVPGAPTRLPSALGLTAPGKLLDLANIKNFGRLDFTSMSRMEMKELLDSRKEFKTQLFSDVIEKLQQDPSKAEVPQCPSVADADSGKCRITDAQRRELALKLERERQTKNVPKVKNVTLPAIERKLAVLFGVNDYTDDAIPSLDNAVLDVQAIGKALREKLGYEVTVMENVKKAEIVRAINNLAIEARKQDSVLVYYAGHGYRLEETGMGYWLPADADADDPVNWVSNADISKMLANVPANQVAMISDSCYSGAFTKERKFKSSQEIKPSEVLTKRSVVIMSSGGDEPVVDAGGKDGHSVFAWSLMEAIRNVDKWRAGANLFVEVQEAVETKFPQKPQYGASVSAGHQAGGDYLFEFREWDDIQ